MRYLRNMTPVQQFIIHNGRQHTIQAMQTVGLDDEIAALFMQKLRGAVEADDGQNRVEFADHTGERWWVANITGDARRASDDYRRKPHPRKHKMQGGARPGYESQGAETTLQQPVQVLEIWPYQRKSLPRHIAEWVLGRDAMSGSPGCLIHARAPTDFEPNDAWELADLILWCKLVDRSIELPKLSQLKSNADLFDAKRGLLEQAYFRIVDPVYTLPTQDEFVALKKAKEAENAKDSNAAALAQQLASSGGADAVQVQP